VRRRAPQVSSRDAVVSSFIHDALHYGKRVDLLHAAAKPTATIDFDIDAAAFFARHALLSKGLSVPGYGSLLRGVIDGGIFFRAASERRTKNYWLPTLNAGLPFTPKRDAVHEATYMAHDVAHFALNPDLVFTGSTFACSPTARALYIAYRMSSEALTMVVADMLYVEGLRKIHSVDYDWSARRIHPLLPLAEATTGKQLLSQDAAGGSWRVDGSLLRSLLYANVAYCLRGDDAPWRELLGGGAGDAAWAAFDLKYRRFFVADYVWTARNYDAMRGEAERGDGAAVYRWWSSASRLRELDAGVVITSLDEYAVKIGVRSDTKPHAIIDAVFEEAWANTILPLMVAQPPPVAPTADPASGVSSVTQSRRLYRALLRYAIGQSAMLSRHPHHRMTAPTQAALDWSLRRWAVDAERGTFGAEQVREYRAMFGALVDGLQADLHITPDDAAVYREVFPVFDPFYVSYDADVGKYEALKSVSERLLGGGV